LYLFPRICTSWSKCMAPPSLHTRFDFTTYAIQVCYIVYTYLKLHINLFRSRRKQKKAKHCYALVRIYRSLSDLRVPFKEYKVNYAFSWEKLPKLQVAKMWNWEDLFQELFYFWTTQANMLANATYPTCVRNVLE
jgi:hypothetical protein